MIANFTPAFIATQLIVPAGKLRMEFCDAVVRGLLIEARSTPNSVPTWYLRHKLNGKTAYDRLGTVRELTISQARKLATQKKVEHAPFAKVAPELKPAKGEMTLDSFWTDHYLPYAKIHKRSWGRDEQLYRIRIMPRFGDCKLSEITRYAVQQFQDALSLGKLSPASQDHHIKLIRRLLNLAVQWEFLEKAVLKGFPLRNVENGVENYLNENQLTALAEVLRADHNRVVASAILFILSTGARKTEALTATWENVDIEAGIWKVDAERAKGKRSRMIPLNDSAKWVLAQLDSKGKSNFLFPSPVSGQPFTTISRVWYRLRKKARIENAVRIHDLRHSFCSLLASKGVGLVQIQRIAGHADCRMTLKYIHTASSELQAAANLASVIVPRATPEAAPEAKEAEVIPAETPTAEILQFPKAA